MGMMPTMGYMGTHGYDEEGSALAGAETEEMGIASSSATIMGRVGELYIHLGNFMSTVYCYNSDALIDVEPTTI